MSRNFSVLITLLAFLLAPLAAKADEYGSPAPLDPAFMQGISGGPIKPAATRSSGNKPQGNKPSRTNKPQGNKPSRSNKPQVNKPSSNNKPQANKPSGSKPSSANKPSGARR